MWRVQRFYNTELYYCLDPDAGRGWPPGLELQDNVDLGTAVTTCDIFNARDYPEEFGKVADI